MKQGIVLLEQLDAQDAEWIFTAAQEQELAERETLIEAGREVEALHIVTSGLLGVFADERDAQLAVLGPGDLAGDMSYVETAVPTETVRALEPSSVLSLPFAALRARATEDSSFSARLHRGLARLLARRLRDANRRLDAAAASSAVETGGSAAWARLAGPLQQLKLAVHEADDAAARVGGAVPDELASRIVGQFLAFCDHLHEVLSAIGNDRVRLELGQRVRDELLPYVLLSAVAERSYRKPRGYAGDFWTIELLYRNDPDGVNELGRLVDRCFLEIPASRALRNRRGLVREEIDKTLGARDDEVARVTSLACGPAREVFDAFAALEDVSALHATLLDIDLHALAFVADRAQAAGVQRQVDLVSENLVRLALGRAETEIRDQDLIYSVGLIDYFGDDLVVQLLNLVHDMLRPGGRVLLGNFHPRHRTRELMDHVLDWELIHRTEEDMDRLFERSSFGRPCTSIRFEQEGINLFAECVR